MKTDKSAFTPLEIRESLLKTAKSLTGFTLIEITIALLILTVGLVGILALFPVGFDAAGRAGNITTATFLAQEKMEDLKREGYNGATVAAALAVTQSRLFTDYPNYRWEVDTNQTGSNYREVIVRVYWPAGQPNERNIELRTYIAKYEP